MGHRLNQTSNGREKLALAGFLVSLTIVGCSAPRRSFGSASATDPAAVGPSNNGSNPTANSVHPAWLVGTYTDPGKVEDNISSGQKSIVLAADGTYTGFYCKSCNNAPGKWSIVAGKLVFDGGSFSGSASLDDFTSNCRILSYSGTRFYRENVVPECPLGGEHASDAECGLVGTYESVGSGDVSDSKYVSVEPDFFWYAELTHTYCVSNQFGSKCLTDITYQFDVWSVSNHALVGPPTDGLTFRQESCATYGQITTSSSSGMSGTAGTSSAGTGGGGAASSGGGGAAGTGGGSAAGTGGGSAAGTGGGSAAGTGGGGAAGTGGGSAAGSGGGGAAGASSGAAGLGGASGAGGGSSSGGASGAGGGSSSGGASSSAGKGGAGGA